MSCGVAEARTGVKISPLAGKPAPATLLIDPARLEREYHDRRPDPDDPGQLVSFGTSGHRGSPLQSSFNEADFGISWFADGELNVAANCLDRHLAERGEQTAIIWEPDVPSEAPRRFTYAQVHEEVCRFANVLKAQGVK